MDYRPLGRTGVKVSPICLGLGAGKRQEVANTILSEALDAGVNFVDTANIYGRGQGEELTGEALKQLGKRQQVVLVTKVHGAMDDTDPNAQGNSRRHIIEQCEASLRRLQTDYVDLYLLHRPQPDIPIDETLRALDDLVHSGKVRYIGCSTYAAWQVVEALWVSKELHLERFVCEQPPYNLLDRRIERELLPMTQTFGLGTMAWSPLAGGILTGKYQRGEPPPAGTRLAYMARMTGSEGATGLSEAVFDVLDGLGALVAEQGCSMADLSLAWCMQQPGISSAVIGPRSPEQLRENLGALNVTITDEVRQRIDAIIPPGGMVQPFYEAEFGPHPHRI